MTNELMIIAEIGQAHDGSLGILHSYIDAVAGTGADAIKFQVHIADAESSEYETFRVPFSYVDRTRADYWRRMEFTEEQWRGIKAHCEEKGLGFVCSPFSLQAVKLLERIGARIYKIGSGEVNNHLMLSRIAASGSDIILSSGMSGMQELDEAVQVIRASAGRISVLQCTSEYPVTPERIGLNMLSTLRERYGVRTGLSDHSGSIFPALAAVALGADVIETHVVFDKRMFGPDTKASITVDQLSQLVEGARIIRKALSHVDKDDTGRFEAMRTLFGKSLAVNRDMRKGEVLSPDDLETKKPAGHGIPPKEYRTVVGKRLSIDLSRGHFLNREHLE